MQVDVLASKNAKFLFYQYNDCLEQNGFDFKTVKHTIVTDDFIALEQIQNQNWQYYVKSALEACQANNAGETTKKPQAQILLDSIENITICKKSYQRFFNQIAQNLNFTISNLPADEMDEINKDLQRENYHVNIETDDFLDCWCDFYFTKGRFPGSQELIMVPQPQIPSFVKTQTALSPIDLYQKFKATNAKVSIQALAALNIYYGGNRAASKNALTEFLHNLTFQALSKENDDIYLSFGYIGQLVLNILESLLKKINNQLKLQKCLTKIQN